MKNIQKFLGGFLMMMMVIVSAAFYTPKVAQAAIGAVNYFKLIGNKIVPINASYGLGNTTTPIKDIVATNVTTTNIYASGVANFPGLSVSGTTNLANVTSTNIYVSGTLNSVGTNYISSLVSNGSSTFGQATANTDPASRFSVFSNNGSDATYRFYNLTGGKAAIIGVSANSFYSGYDILAPGVNWRMSLSGSSDLKVFDVADPNNPFMTFQTSSKRVLIVTSTIVNATITTSTISDLNATRVISVSGTTTNEYISGLSKVTGTSTLATTTVTWLTVNSSTLDGLNFTSATGTKITVANGTFTNATTTNFNVSNLFSATNLAVSNVTSSKEYVNGNLTVVNTTTLSTTTVTSLSINTLGSQIYVNPNFSGDFGTYINTLYAAASGNTVIFNLPDMNVVSSSFRVGIVCGTNNKKCFFKGNNTATILNFGGSAGSRAFEVNVGVNNVHRVNPFMDGISLFYDNPTTTNPVTGIYLGGTNGAAHTVVVNSYIYGFGIGYEWGQNAYDLTIQNSQLRGNGHNIYGHSANNSGEGISLVDVWNVDPAFNSSTGCLYLENDAVASLRMLGGSMDDCQMYVNPGNTVEIYGTHIENPDPLYGRYTPIFISPVSGAYTSVTMHGGRFWNSATGATTTPTQLIYNGGRFAAYGVTVQRGNEVAGTVINNFVKNDASDGGGSAILDGVRDINGAMNYLMDSNAPDDVSRVESSNGSWAYAAYQRSNNQVAFHNYGGIGGVFGDGDYGHAYWGLGGDFIPSSSLHVQGKTTLQGDLSFKQPTKPTVVVGGTGWAAGAISGSDLAGSVSSTLGSSAGQITVKFVNNKATAPFCQITSANQNASRNATSTFVTSSVSQFSINVPVVPTQTGAANYNYFCVESP